MRADSVIIRQQIQDDYYTVYSPEMLSESEFQKVLTPDERARQMHPRGFIEPQPFRLPDHAGSFVHIRGSLKD